MLFVNVDYKIKSARHGTVLDDWAGKVGENSAALMHDDDPLGENRRWRLLPVDGRPGWYRIKGSKGTVLDDWAGKVGEDSAALMHDDNPMNDENRFFQIVAYQDHYVIRSTKGTVLDDWAGKVGEDAAAFMPDDGFDYQNTNRLWDFIPLGQP